MMATFHVQGHRKLYIHNNLDQGADNAKSDIERKLAEGNREGIGFDYMTCGVMLAFTFEAQVNFMGKRFLNPWYEKQRWKESRTRKFEQIDKWSFCLTAGTLSLRIRRDHEQTTAPEPHPGLQGEGGACCRQE